MGARWISLAVMDDYDRSREDFFDWANAEYLVRR